MTLKNFNLYPDDLSVKIRLGISTKLIFMVTFIVVTAIGVVVYVATDLFKEDSLGRVKEMNKDLAESLAEQTRGILKDSLEKMTLMAQTVAQSKGQGLSPESQQLVQNVLRSNDDLLSFGVYQPDANGSYKEIYFATKDEVLAEFDVALNDLKTLPQAAVAGAVRKHPEAIAILNTSPLFDKGKKPMFTLSLAFLTKESAQTKERWLIRSEVRQESLLKLFEKRKYITVYLVDADGNLLVHSNKDFIRRNYNVSTTYPIVQKLRENMEHTYPYQTMFNDSEGTAYEGALKTVGIGGVGVVAQIEEDRALAAVMKVEYESLLVTIIIVGVAFILNFIFSKSMTSPLTTLYRATEKIAEGKFDVYLEPQSHDEIGALTRAFSKMTLGLQERDKLKTTFSKFHSKEVAQKILSGEIKLGGERKIATIFFSDIRNFTAMSETMSPDEVVNMLNEYMTEMVNIIYKHHGVVDKYVGDAIMALWGVPNPGSQDPFDAVTAALEMRRALKDLNQKRSARNQPELRIGMGIHTGEVLAGNIGSDQRLEYTVIGDSVNQASRIESANKDFGSDILISDSTYALVKNKGVVVGPGIPIRVKGKSETLTVHQVIGLKKGNGVLESILSPQEQEAILQGAVHSEFAPQEDAPYEAPRMIARPVPPQPAPQTSTVYFGTQTAAHTHTHAHAYVPAPAPVPVNYAEPPVAPDPVTVTPAYAHAQLQHKMQMAAQMPGAEVFPQASDGTPIYQLATVTHYKQPAPPPPSPMGAPVVSDQWYLVRDPLSKEHEGPFTMAQIKALAAQPGFPVENAYVFREGDMQMTPLVQVPGFSRRTETPVAINAPLPPAEVQSEAVLDEWYIYGTDAKTYGPYSVGQLIQALEAGHVTRTTYCWKQGMESWIYLHQIPGFDRRLGTTVAKGPIPLTKIKKPA